MVKIVAYPYTDKIETPIGPLIIKATNDAIHEIYFQQEDSVITVHSSPVTLNCKQQLFEYFSGTRTSFQLPLAPHGTSFQQNVWQKLQSIPFGDTISYLQLAIHMGDEKTIRAAASANGKNLLAIVIPCHRVIGSNGSLTGYAWGLKRKQWLLDFEAKTSGKKLSLF